MWRVVAGSAAASAQRESREPLWRLGRGIADRVNGVPSATKFQRVYDAPTMDPSTLLRTLSDLKLERSSDVFLMEALARRCAASMEEFFPPQLETAIESFAELRFSDQQLLQAFVGRLDDLVADASPRRLVRLLRDGAALRLRPDAWLERLLPQMRRQLPNLHLGLPTMLASLRALRFHGPELADLLLAQGLLAERAEQTQTQTRTAQAQSQSQRFFIQLFERWSRLSSPGKLHSKAAETAEQRAVDLVSPDTVQSEDIREGLSLLAGLVRRGRQREAATLEQLLEERLRDRGEGQGQGQGQGMGHGCDDALVALLWMQGLSLRSAKLWRACGDAVEVSLSGDRLLSTRSREPLCGAVQALASLSPSWDHGTDEAALLAELLTGMTQPKQLARYSASQTLSLLHAACLHHEQGGGDRDSPSTPWPQLVRQTFRLARQLTLPERRLLSTVVEYLKGEKAEVMGKLQAMPPLPLASLPPLTQGYPGPEESWLQVETGIEALLQQPGQSSQGSHRKHCAVKFLAFEDTLTSTEPGIEVEDKKDLRLAPSCQLTVRALAHAGWELELRP